MGQSPWGRRCGVGSDIRAQRLANSQKKGVTLLLEERSRWPNWRGTRTCSGALTCPRRPSALKQGRDKQNNSVPKKSPPLPGHCLSQQSSTQVSLHSIPYHRKVCMRAEDGVQWGECLPSRCQALGSIPSVNWTWWYIHTPLTPILRSSEVRESELQGHPWLQREIEDILDSMSPCLKIKM